MKKNALLTSLLTLFSFLSIQSADLKVLPTTGRWHTYGAYISDLQIELTSDHHYARVELSFYLNVDSVHPYSGTGGWNGGGLPSYKNQMLEAMLDFSMPRGVYFYDSYLWLNETTIVRADLIGHGEANRIYNGIVNRQMDPSILNKVNDNSQTKSNNYSLKVFPISTTFQRKVKIAYAIPYTAFQSNKEYLELPTEILNFMPASSRFNITINKSTDMNFAKPTFPLSYKPVSDNAQQLIIELSADEIRKTNRNFLEFDNLNPKLISLYTQAINSEEGFYDLRIRTSQLADIASSTSIFEIKIPMESAGIISSRYNNSNNLLSTSESYFESGKYNGQLNMSDSIRLNYKGTTMTQSIKQAISSADKSAYIYQNWTNLYCDQFNSKEALTYSLKHRVLSVQSAFLALETGDTVLVAKSNDMTNVDVDFGSIQETKDMEISIYPNPFVDKLTIKSRETLRSIKLINITGQLVYAHTFELPKKEFEIDLSDLNLQKGVYIILVETASGIESIRILKE
jgi:hypothetical protein